MATNCPFNFRTARLGSTYHLVNKVLYGEAPPLGPLLYTIFGRKVTPFVYVLLPNQDTPHT